MSHVTDYMGIKSSINIFLLNYVLYVVVNYTIVTDSTIRQPGFNLPRQSWSLLNHFRTGQGPCHAVLHKCGQLQTVSHIMDACPLTKFNGGLQLLHEAEDDTVKWLESVYSDYSTSEIK